MIKEELVKKALQNSDNEMREFGKQNGFPVIFVLSPMENELNEIAENKIRLTMFKKDQMHKAAKFASEHGGELGVFEPKNKSM